MYFNETSGNSGGSDSSWQQTTSYQDTGLSENTQYTYRVKARNGDSDETSYTATSSKYTLVDTPTGLATTSISTTSITVSVDTFPDATSGSSGYLFWQGANNSGWIQTNSWQDTGLTCNTSYTYAVKYRNGDGIETVTTSQAFMTDQCSASTTPTGPTIGTPIVLSSTVIRWNFADNSDDETGFRLYNNADAIATSSATVNLSHLDETGLSENTQYTRYVKAYNSYGESASSLATSTYTLADTPTGFNFMRHPSSVDIYVDSFPNDTTDSSGYLFWRTDNSAYNSGWIQTNNWQDSHMVEGTTYTYAVKYRNGNGVETATTTLGGVSFMRDNGGGGTPTIPQQTTSTSSVQATTTLSNTTSTIQATSTQATSTVSFEKPISQMSQDEIKAKIIQITQMIAQLQLLLANAQPTTNLLSTIPNTFQFQATLKQGIADIAVKYLQIILNQDPYTQVAQTGVGSSGKETSYFGLKTKQAVIKFQEKYKDTILKPLGLTKGTGIIGKTTKAKLNQLLGK